MATPILQVPKKPKKKTGRPPKFIDWNKVDELIIHQWPISTIATYFDINEKNFYLKAKKKYKGQFSQHVESKRQEGLGNLRSKQYTMALDGNVTMLIWLGKQLLDQTDKNSVKNETKLDVKVTSLLELIKSAPPTILEGNYNTSYSKQLSNNSVDMIEPTWYPEGSTKK